MAKRERKEVVEEGLYSDSEDGAEDDVDGAEDIEDAVVGW